MEGDNFESNEVDFDSFFNDVLENISNVNVEDNFESNEVDFDNFFNDDLEKNSNVNVEDNFELSPLEKKAIPKKKILVESKKVLKRRKGIKMPSGPIEKPVLDDIGNDEVVVGEDTFHIVWGMTSNCDSHYGFQKIADAKVTLNGKEVANYWVDYGPNSGFGSFYRGNTLIAEGHGSFSDFPNLVKMDVKGEDLEKELSWGYTFCLKPKSDKDKK